MSRHLRLACCLSLVFAGVSPLMAQGQAETAPVAGEQAPAESPMTQLIKSIDWKTEGTGTIGSMAEIQVPAGYRYTASAGTVKLMEAFGNLTSGGELGYISPLDMSWFAVFEFDDVGYVKDDEKDKLDASAILKQLKEGQEAANAELTKRGMPTLEVVGWQTPPFYNPETKNLEWAIKIRGGDGSTVVNYKTKLLGRRGVMDVVLVCGEEEMATVVPEYQKVLAGFSYKKDDSYASYTSGDKIAEFGLTGLIVGGGLLVAAKSGLLGKLIKPIIIGLVAVGAILKRFVFGKTRETI